MGLNILLVDDSGVMRKLVSKALRQGGLDIASTKEAGNGQEGLDSLGEGDVDFVLCDWNMPVMDGLTFVQEARKSSSVPIVMLTTESGDDKVSAALEAGANDFITKPFTPEKLKEKVDEVLQRIKKSA
jgi:two-component system chemotaxis response regulator CheY